MSVSPDDYVLETSKYIPDGISPFISKEVQYVNDINSGNYTSNQITYDLQQFSTNGSYVAWKAGYIVIPRVLRLQSIGTAVTGFSTLNIPYALGLKNNYASIINSVQVQTNNVTTVPQVNYLPCLWNTRLLSEMSHDSLVKTGASRGFWPDTFTTAGFTGGYAGATAQTGNGVFNNFNLPQFPSSVDSTATTSVGQTNWGFWKRQQLTTAFDPAELNLSSFLTENNMGTVGLNYYKNYNATTKLWFVYSIVYLKDISTFFENLPLARGLYHRMILQLNQSKHTFKIVIDGGALDSLQITSTTAPNGISCLLLANGSQAGNGLTPLVDACITTGDGTYTFEISDSVGTDTTVNVSPPALSQTQIHVPCYKFEPSKELEYLSLNKYKFVPYSEYVNSTYVVPISGGVGSFNQNISQGLVGVKRIFILPYANNTYLAYGSNAQNECVSPLSTAPGTCAPYVQFYNLQVQVSGRTVFLQNETYSYQQWLDENSGNLSLNDGLDNALTSGLVSYADWIASPMVVIDLSRRLGAERMTPKSVSVQTTLYTQLSSIQLQIFIETDKAVYCNLENGSISTEPMMQR